MHSLYKINQYNVLLHPSQRKQNNNVDETWIDKARKSSQIFMTRHAVFDYVCACIIWGGMHYIMPYGSEVFYEVQVFDVSGQYTRMVE